MPGRKPRFSRFHHRAREDDAPHFLALERRHGHGHGKVRFARARRADAERDGAVANSIDIVLLTCGFRPDSTAAVREQYVLAQRRGRKLRIVQKLDGTGDVARVGDVAGLHVLDKLREQGGERLDLDGVAFKHDGVAAHGDARVERLFDLMQQAIARSDDQRHVHRLRRGQGDVRILCHGR